VSSLFLSLIERNIFPKIFFDSLLSDEDLSNLLCTCRGMKKNNSEMENHFPHPRIQNKHSMTDKMLGNMIMHYSSNIKNLIIYSYDSLLKMVGYHLMALLHSNLLELSIDTCLKRRLCVISHSLVNLTSLSMSYSPSVSSDII
jgi:hypothetical protein